MRGRFEMSFVKSWLLGVTTAALAVALAQALTPEGTVKKVGKLMGGLVLLLAALRPLLQLDSAVLTAAMFDSNVANERGADAGEETWKALIEEKTAAYIAEEGERLGCQVAAAVTVQEDENGWPTPWQAEITGIWSEEQRQALSHILTEDLEIPVERQTFHLSAD